MSLAIFCVAYYLSAGVGVGLRLHRGLSHRAFRLPPWLERAIIYNFSEAIDSVAHLWGSAKHGLLPRQFDWTWQLIRGLRYVGLATDVKVPDERAVLRKMGPR